MNTRSRRNRGTEPPKALNHRRELRAGSTNAESLLWAAIRARKVAGLKFRRQHSIGPYIVDFACVDERLVVELESGYHDVVVEHDLRRQQDLQETEYTVLRFWNEDVLEDVEAVTIAIRRTLRNE